MAVDAPPSTSPALLQQLALPGNDEAWKEFIDRYSPMIEERCRRAGLQRADAEDVRAVVCVKLVDAMKGFRHDPTRRFRGYLQRIVENAIRTHWRVLKRRPGWIGRGGDWEISMPDPLASLGAELDEQIQSRIDAVLRVVDRVRFEVGPENWRAFELTAVDGLPGAVVAERLGKSTAAVYVAKWRVRDRLRVESSAEQRN